MKLYQAFHKNRMQYLTLIAFILMLLLAISGLDRDDWMISLLRGLSVGAITFLVASGFSLIIGLMDVLNMAHGTLFMIGAYVGWTVVVRPDTFVDILPMALLFSAGLLVFTIWENLFGKVRLSKWAAKSLPFIGLGLTALVMYLSFPKYPITKWDVGNYANSAAKNAYDAGQGIFRLPAPKSFAENVSPALVLGGIFLAGVLVAFTLAAFKFSRQAKVVNRRTDSFRVLITSLMLVIFALVLHKYNTLITEFLFSLDNTWLFLIGLLVAFVTGALLGGLIEVSMIRPLYDRPVYQLMMTLGISTIGVEIVRSLWGLQEFTFPRPSIFSVQGGECPAQSWHDVFRNHCATIETLGGRVRVYNEIFVPILGIIVLIVVWLLLKRTRLGMIVRAGVQDPEMVQALGINVRQVFTIVFALGVGLAALGGIVGAPSIGLSTTMGGGLLLNMLIALAIGGLTSYPGAALGSLIVGLVQQFIIRYGQVGINLPFLEEAYKPSPPIVPAATLILMVIVLLIFPNGLMGKKE